MRFYPYNGPASIKDTHRGLRGINSAILFAVRTCVFAKKGNWTYPVCMTVVFRLWTCRGYRDLLAQDERITGYKHGRRSLPANCNLTSPSVSKASSAASLG